MRVLIFGGRDFLDWPLLFAFMDEEATHIPITRVIQGGARGADTGGAFWAFCRGIPYETFEADWKRLGPKAGPLRNQRMIDEGKLDYAVGFPGGRGTNDMARRLARAKIKWAAVGWMPDFIQQIPTLL